MRKGPPELFDKVPPGKSVLRAPPGKGLPIGNHTSQFFANVYLNELDQFVKHGLKAPYYVRYVDDLLLLSRSREELLGWRAAIDAFLRERLLLELNPRATRIAPLSSGIDFLGVVVHPHHRLVRRRVVRNLLTRLNALEGLLTDDTAGYSWVRYRKGTSEYLRAMTASYRAHFLHANTWKLRTAIGRRFPWLRRAAAAPGERPFWELRRAFPCLAAQAHWLARKFPGRLLAIQVGKFWEFYGPSATCLARALGLQLLRGRRRALRPWVRVPLDRLPLVLEAARASAVRDVVLVAEEGQGAGWVLDRRAVAVGRLRSSEKDTDAESAAGARRRSGFALMGSSADPIDRSGTRTA